MNNHVALPMAVGGFFKIEAITLHADGTEKGRRIVADWFPNLITDSGLNQMGTGNYLETCAVGSGNAVPTVTDTALQTFVASTTTQQSKTRGAQGSAPFFGWGRKVFRFAVGAAAGNLSEVGVGITNTNLFSRALILDGGGNPTTITVLSTEVLDVTYELRSYPPLVDTNGVITIGGVNYNWTMRACNVTTPAGLGEGSGTPGWGFDATLGGIFDGHAATTFGLTTLWTGAMGDITGRPSGSSATRSATTTPAYVNNSLFSEYEVVFGLNDGNLAGGVQSIDFAFVWCAFQMEFSAKIPKDETKQLTLKFRQTWTRHP